MTRGLVATAPLLLLMALFCGEAWADGYVTVTLNPSTGLANGSVTSPTPGGNPGGNPPVAINCPTTCSTDWNNGVTVSLTAHPTDANITVTWSVTGSANSINCPTGTSCSFNHSGSGGGNSVAVTTNFTQPAPTINSGGLSPSSASGGGPQFTLTVNGTNFTHASTVKWNGVALATTFVSTTQLTATVPAANLTSLGSFPITVTNPTPGGGTSSAQNFTVINGRKGQVIVSRLVLPDAPLTSHPIPGGG